MITFLVLFVMGFIIFCIGFYHGSKDRKNLDKE